MPPKLASFSSSFRHYVAQAFEWLDSAFQSKKDYIPSINTYPMKYIVKNRYYEPIMAMEAQKQAQLLGV